MTARPPFAEWLQGLQWDGKKRLENWLLRTLHPYTRPTSRRYHHYLRLVGRSIVLGHVARALHPGSKFDHSVLLMGPQGAGKSLLINTLIGAEHVVQFVLEDDYTIESHIHACEITDLRTDNKAWLAGLKSWITATHDTVDDLYSDSQERHPRAFVPWITTHAAVLDDGMTAGRRLWPVYVQRPSMRWLRQHRAQVFAEAVEMYRSGARITPTREQDQAYIQPEAARLQRPAQP